MKTVIQLLSIKHFEVIFLSQATNFTNVLCCIKRTNYSQGTTSIKVVHCWSYISGWTSSVFQNILAVHFSLFGLFTLNSVGFFLRWKLLPYEQWGFSDENSSTPAVAKCNAIRTFSTISYNDCTVMPAAFKINWNPSNFASTHTHFVTDW